jgi:hypothetical protein
MEGNTESSDMQELSEFLMMVPAAWILEALKLVRVECEVCYEDLKTKPVGSLEWDEIKRWIKKLENTEDVLVYFLAKVLAD